MVSGPQLPRMALGPLLVSVVLGVFCAVITFLTLDSFGNDNRFSNAILNYKPSDLLKQAEIKIWAKSIANGNNDNADPTKDINDIKMASPEPCKPITDNGNQPSYNPPPYNPPPYNPPPYNPPPYNPPPYNPTPYNPPPYNPPPTPVDHQKLEKDVRVLVWVMTYPENHMKKAVHVRDTWGKRVNKLLFMSSVDDPRLPTVNLHHIDGRDELWGKTKAAFKHVYQHHLGDADWFMKADDDTFVVVENLRYMLSLYDPNTPIYFGSRFKKFSKQGYMSGGGGYVLSRAALKLFVERALTHPTLCKMDDTGAEDAEMGKCLDKVGVLAGDSRDDQGKGRFFPFVPAHHLISGFIGEKSWYWDYIYYPMKVGPDCCSDTAITFHYISPDKMRELDYLLYHLRPYGAMQERLPFPPALPPDLASVPIKAIEKYGNRTT